MKKFLAVIIGIVVVVLVVGVFLPTEYSVTRSVEINADPEAVHLLVGDLKRWDDWTPWKEEDPTIEVEYGEKTTGVGASQTWAGESGDGSLTFTQCAPDTGIGYDMAFDQGELKSKGSILYRKNNASTTVTWSMNGDMSMPVIGGYFSLMMDNMVGPMFEQGLEKLKEKVEGT
jgi:hypothetical protein